MNERTRLEPRKIQDRVAETTGLDALEHIETALRGLQYGTVTVIVQDGVVVQVERTERTRFRGR